LPDGQITGVFCKSLSSPLAKKISLSPSGKSPLEARAVPHPKEGRIAIVTKRWVRDAVDALLAEDERSAKRTAKVCGPDVSTLTSTRDNALHCVGTVTKSPIAGESAP
jgi:hypothetical protein